MGYVYITCPDCGREVKHHTRDIPAWSTRICPGCGQKLTVCAEADLAEKASSE